MVKTEQTDLNVFVMPEALVADEETLTDSYGKFTLQPLERGFGTTLGNSLRRTLLSSLGGSAIEGVRIQGVQHEFTTVTGVQEDVPELVLNLKEVRLRFHAAESGEKKTLIATKEGPGEMTAGDLAVDSAVEIINPDHVIAHLDDGATLELHVDIGNGRGFFLADDMRTEDTPLGFVPVDAIYSPIRRVNFEVGNARVGQRTDYDSLGLEVWTDGTMTPAAAIAQARQARAQPSPVLPGRGRGRRQCGDRGHSGQEDGERAGYEGRGTEPQHAQPQLPPRSRYHHRGGTGPQE